MCAGLRGGGHRSGALSALCCALLLSAAPMLEAQSVANNPYRAVHGWAKLPDGRVWGVASGVYPDRDGRHIWILERCGGDNCAGTDVDPILKFDLDGNLVTSFGAGLLAWPHGFHIDSAGNIWVTEGAPVGVRRGEAGFALGMGHQVFKFSPTGELLMTLGEAGVAGDGPDHFNGPSGVAVAPNGDIWIVDGHRGGNNRLIRFSSDGRFMGSWGGGVGSESAEPSRFNDPHGLAIDSQGRILVADRGNNRIQIFDPEGNYIHQWTQFGRPSGIFIDSNDVVYVGDGMSDARWNPGWERGIRIGDGRTGWVTAFIPDGEIDVGSGVEFLAADAQGNIYAGEVGRQRLVKYVRVRP
jgi:DNA-binding beta-propeller fold protein YncE